MIVEVVSVSADVGWAVIPYKATLILLLIAIKVQLTPEIFFRLIKSPQFHNNVSERIFGVAFFLDFLQSVKVRNFGFDLIRRRATGRMGLISI